jgi:hypothetical protein
MVETRLRSSGLDRGLRRNDERGAAQAASPGLTSDLWSSADLPDRAGPGNLDELSVARIYELAGRSGLAEVPHGPIVHEVGAVIGPELQIHGAVDPVKSVRESLLERGVVSKPRLTQLDLLPVQAEVHELASGNDYAGGNRPTRLQTR